MNNIYGYSVVRDEAAAVSSITNQFPWGVVLKKCICKIIGCVYVCMEGRGMIGESQGIEGTNEQ